MSGVSVFILAVEPSADKLGADLVRAIKDINSQTTLLGIGGAEMASVGVNNDFDISPLAILGLTEALKAYPVVRRKVKEAAALILSQRPDCVVLIDSWGFMIRVAEALKKAQFKGKIIKYVGPQVWAMRPGRAKTLARFTDHLLSIQTMDAPYYEKHGLPVTFVGNPMFDEDYSPNHGDDFMKKYDLTGPVLSVLFGSRPAELESLYEPFAKTVEQLSKSHPDISWFTVSPPNIRAELDDMRKNDPRTQNIIEVPEAEKKALFANTDIALACSGTVTTQLAMCGVPSVVAYKLSPVTFFIAKRLFKPDYISLVNISAQEKLIPEFMQSDVNAANLTAVMSAFLDDQALRAKTSERLLAQTKIMKGKGGSASGQAAAAILKILTSPSGRQH